MINFIILLFCAAFAFLVGSFSTSKYSSSELDPNPFALKIDTFYYHYLSGGRIGPSGPTYVFKSSSYKSIFIVPIDAYYSFDKDLFEKTVKKGDTINIIIRKNFKIAKIKGLTHLKYLKAIFFS